MLAPKAEDIWANIVAAWPSQGTMIDERLVKELLVLQRFDHRSLFHFNILPEIEFSD